MTYKWNEKQYRLRNEASFKRYKEILQRNNYITSLNSGTFVKQKNLKLICFYFDISERFKNSIDAQTFGILRATYFRAKKEVKEIMSNLK